MALDTANRRGSLIPGFLPVPNGAIDQEDRQVFIPRMFATPLAIEPVAPTGKIDSLIDKQDNFEIIRDQIAAILVLETSSQMQLATAQGEDPDQWKLRVYSERSNPWNQFLSASVTDKSPIVNVWYQDSNFDPAASNVVDRQKATGTFNIDCYGYAESQVDGVGHRPGDKGAALEAHRALRLVRNILMADVYTYLCLRGLVWRRWPTTIETFQPQQDGNAMQQIVGSRITFQVVFNELAPQNTFQNLELLSIDILRKEDGQLVAEADYVYP